MSVNLLLTKYSQYLLTSLLKGINRIQIKQNTLTLTIFINYLQFICEFLKNHTTTQYSTLIDIVVIDYPLKTKRFEVIYSLLSIPHNNRLFLKCYLSTLPSIYSITSIYSVAS